MRVGCRVERGSKSFVESELGRLGGRDLRVVWVWEGVGYRKLQRLQRFLLGEKGVLKERRERRWNEG